MQLTPNSAFKFDRLLPIYNWIYPLSQVASRAYDASTRMDVFSRIADLPIRSRALYFHVPFCETICSFCPFVRGTYSNSTQIDAYVSALLIEIEEKAQRLGSGTAVPIRAIFFGGGTPSLLTPLHIAKLGRAIRAGFDLSQLKEFSFEFEVKSIDEEKLDALRGIGVTHARFGLQTFSERYRGIFNLTASVDQVYAAAELLPRYFPHVSCDLIYGMAGQTEPEFVSDITKAAALSLSNLDFYPINNLVTQPKLHRSFDEKGLLPLSVATKHYMNIILRGVLQGAGYFPHNGHGYVKGTIAGGPVTDEYSFVYHEHVYGYADHDVIGFGVNAISSTNAFTIHNEPSRERYTRQLLAEGICDFVVGEHVKEIDASRPVALRLPYHGAIRTEGVDWDAIPSDTHRALADLERADLIKRGSDTIELTDEGWRYYSNLMYYLIPSQEKRELDRFIRRAQQSGARRLEEVFVPPLPQKLAFR